MWSLACDEAAAFNSAEARIVMLLGRFTEDNGLPVTGLIIESVASPIPTFAAQTPAAPPRLEQGDLSEQFSQFSMGEKTVSQALSYSGGHVENYAYENKFQKLFSELPTYRRVDVMRFSKQETPYRGQNYKKFEFLDKCVRQRMVFV
jgi:hypothetical protein